MLALIIISAPASCLHDFTIYWKATSNFIRGFSPYDLPNYETYLEQCPALGVSNINMKAWGPPWLFALLAPIGMVSLTFGKIIFVLGFIVSILVASIFLLKVYGLPLKTKSFVLYFSLAPIGIWWTTLQWGSPSWFILLGIAGFLSFSLKKADFLSGLFLIITLVKVHLVVSFLVAVLLRALLEKRYQLVFGFFSGFSILLLISTYLNPLAFFTFWEMYNSDAFSWLTSASIPSVITGILPAIREGAFLICIIMQLLFAIYLSRKESFAILAAVMLPLSVAFSPFAWGHDYIVCLPAYIFLLKIIWESKNKDLNRGYIIRAIILVNLIALFLAAKFFIPGWWFVSYGVALTIITLHSYFDRREEISYVFSQ